MRTLQYAVALLAAVLIFSLMLLTLVDVTGRNLFNHPLRGATELTEIALVLLSFLLFPVVALRGSHIVADVADALHSRVLDVLRLVLTALLGCGLFAMIGWRMWLLAGRVHSYGDVSANLGIPLSPVLYTVALLSGFGALCFLVHLRDLPRVMRGQPAAGTTQNALL